MRSISMLRTILLLLALVAAPTALAQKWVDEKGRVYYGDKPKGVNVKPAEMKGGGIGTSSSDDLTRQQLRKSDPKVAAAPQAKGSRHVGTAVEFKPIGPPPTTEMRESRSQK